MSCPEREYPIIPINKYVPPQHKMPTILAFLILLSHESFNPLKIEKKLVWYSKAKIILGITEMAANQSSGKAFIGIDPRPSVLFKMKCAIMQTRKMATPSTPNRERNFSFSILFWRAKGNSIATKIMIMNISLQ